MPFLLPAYLTDLGPQQMVPCGSLPPYNVKLRRTPTDMGLGSNELSGSLYQFVPDDMVYYRGCDTEHSLNIEWRVPKNGAPPWSIHPSTPRYVKLRLEKLRTWTADHPSNSFQVQLVAPPWPGATELNSLVSDFPPAGSVPEQELLFTQMLTACSTGGNAFCAACANCFALVVHDLHT
jgi:hypothetical protein